MKKKYNYTVLKNSPLVEELISIEDRTALFEENSTDFISYVTKLKRAFDEGYIRVDKNLESMFANGYTEGLEEGYPEKEDEELLYDWDASGLNFDIDIYPYKYEFETSRDAKSALSTAKSHGYADSWREGRFVYLSEGLKEANNSSLANKWLTEAYKDEIWNEIKAAYDAAKKKGYSEEDINDTIIKATEKNKADNIVKRQQQLKTWKQNVDNTADKLFNTIKYVATNYENKYSDTLSEDEYYDMMYDVLSNIKDKLNDCITPVRERGIKMNSKSNTAKTNESLTNEATSKYIDVNRENYYLKEVVNKPLTAKDKADIKKKIDTTDDSELIAAYVNSKVAKKTNTNQSPFTESADGKANDATDIVKLIDKKFPELEFVDERDLDNNQVGLIYEGASKVDQVDLGIYLDGLYVWYKIKGDKLLIKADEDANYLDEDVTGGWEDPEWRKYYGVDDDSFYDPYELEDNIDIEYDEEEDF